MERWRKVRRDMMMTDEDVEEEAMKDRKRKEIRKK